MNRQSRHRRGFRWDFLAPLTVLILQSIVPVRCLLASQHPPVGRGGGGGGLGRVRTSLHRSTGRRTTDATSVLPPASTTSSSSSALGLVWHEYDYDELLASDAEQSRVRRRTVMDDDRWLRHRASDRFFRNLGTIFDSYVFKNLLDEVGVVMVVCFLIIGWNQAFFDGYDTLPSVSVTAAADAPAHLHHLGPPLAETAFGSSAFAVPLKLPPMAFTISASPLGLLLVFRTNTSYNRWLEGRKAWDQVVTGCRDLMLMASVWTKPRDAPAEEKESSKEQGDDDGSSSDEEAAAKQKRREREDALRKLGAATWAVPRTLRKHISGPWDPDEEFAADVKAVLGRGDDAGAGRSSSAAEKILTARHKPYRALHDLHKVVHTLPDLESTHRTLMGRAIGSISRACTECERLYTTPVPLSYTRHTARFLTLWLLSLPLALYDSFGYSWNHAGLIPTVGALSFLFFGIEEIAVSLEEPFSILPLDQLTEDSRLAAADALQWAFEEEEEAGRGGGDDDDVLGIEGSSTVNGRPGVPDILPYNDMD